MKKRFMGIIAAIVAIFCGLFAFSACSKAEFKVNFVVDGAVYATLNTNGEEIIKMPENPTKDDYDFDGWYWDKDTWQTPFTANSLLDAPLSSDMNVYCKWKPKPDDGGNEETKNGLSFKTLTVDGTNVYGKVSNATETFSFLEEITANGTSKFNVALDIYGAQQVATKTISLSVGDNIAYIMETIDGETVKMYTVTVRRRSIYTVSFYNGWFEPEQQVEEDSFAIEPAAPSKAGYTFDKWNYDFSKPITQNTSVGAVWKAHTDTPYKVQYYLENADDNGYTLHETVDLQGETDTFARAEIKTFEHFFHTYSPNGYYYWREGESGNIRGDGSLILKVYYNREKYSFSNANPDFGSITNEGMKKYGATISTAATPANLACEFLGWYSDETLLSTDNEYNFIVGGNVHAKFRIKEEMAVFDFNATADTCTITGLKDKATTEIIIPDYITFIDGGAFNGCSSLISITTPFVWKEPFGYIFGKSSYSGSAETVQYGGKNSSDVVKYTYFIPTSLKNVKVTRGNIPEAAFYNCNKITNVIIENDVKSVGEKAFYNCEQIKNINIPIFINTIEASTFANCVSLTTITIPESIVSIGYWAFQNCANLTNIFITDLSAWCKISGLGNLMGEKMSGDENRKLYLNNEPLTKIIIPENITIIETSAFSNCKSLTKVTLPNGFTSIGSGAFNNCSNLASINIPNSVTSIGHKAFNNCGKLTNIIIPNSVTFIGNYAFKGCNKLLYNEKNDLNYIGNLENPYLYLIGIANSGLSNYTIDQNCKFIGDAAFANCENLTEVSVGNNVTFIGENAFMDCDSLTKLVIGNSVNTICAGAFQKCKKLTDVIIGDGVTSMGNGIFSWCDSLKYISYSGTIKNWKKIARGIWGGESGDYSIHCSDGSYLAYKWW